MVMAWRKKVKKIKLNNAWQINSPKENYAIVYCIFYFPSNFNLS